MAATGPRPYELIRRKRDGLELSAAEIAVLVDGFVSGAVPDYQMSAFLMAVFFRGMSAAEIATLTRAMRDSGETLDLSSFGGRTADKHSTGGVGDKVSLVLAPLAAAAGLVVPMMSGRGLGHTGGTIDKLESIPGFDTALSTDAFLRQLDQIGVAMVAQSDRLAPADRRMYALRDVTATVESIPLIAASIMSKKLAEGCDNLVLDVKFGRGAFMQKMVDAEALARTMTAIGNANGVRTRALLSSMEQPLGLALGNAVEVEETIACLRGAGPADLRELTLRLGAEMMLLAGVEASREAATARLARLLDDGSALERFRGMVVAQGGDPAYVDDPQRFYRPAVTLPVVSRARGVVAGIDTLEVGLTIVALGGGRARLYEPIRHEVGVLLNRKVGDEVDAGDVLAQVLAATSAAAGEAVQRLQAAIVISGALDAAGRGGQPPAATPFILDLPQRT
ncbi:MAG: thymidine phosphorylase [Candidatus Schekmanbacteria bacterium]|nr:thymidine phosphorylase [Candidatus Schekmanbacteria bacterium]